jgi:hypothetical protein
MLPVESWRFVTEVDDLGDTVPGENAHRVEEGEHQAGPYSAGSDDDIGPVRVGDLLIA